MNCNPFTKGHRYLIEQACSKVDFLYVLIVEEDCSVFSFEDRFCMAERGVIDIDNVQVIPSGKYVISKKTFGQYFEKEQVYSVEEMDYDVHIFGEVVAKELGIQHRFIGEEPYDIVTKKYNETMKKILPQYGIKVTEIPRIENENGDTISATKVRKYIKAGNYKAMKEMLPISTLKHLREKGIV